MILYFIIKKILAVTHHTVIKLPFLCAILGAGLLLYLAPNQYLWYSSCSVVAVGDCHITLYKLDIFLIFSNTNVGMFPFAKYFSGSEGSGRIGVIGTDFHMRGYHLKIEQPILNVIILHNNRKISWQLLQFF